MPKIAEIIEAIEEFAPLALQEEWDNSGLQIGDKSREVTSALLCLDISEDIVDEAIEKGANLIISHHPLLFRGLKSITGRSDTERIVIKAIKHDISIYSAHTNIDSAAGGVSFKIAEKIGMSDISILRPQSDKLIKIVVFAPDEAAVKIREEMSAAGAGKIGNYDCCSYTTDGHGHFRALSGANPHVGSINEIHTEREQRIEMIVPAYLKNLVINAMIKAHPYEEPAYDIIPLLNNSHYSGLGVIGTIAPIKVTDLILNMKTIFNIGAVKISGNKDAVISKIALCGGSGAEFIDDAIAAGADIFITGDVKYHEFTTYADKIIIADIGHYESEQFTKDIFYNIIREKFPNFVPYYPDKEKNPINYL